MCGIVRFILLAIIGGSYGADVLVIIASPSYSHQAPLRPIWKQLALRGHNVTLITTDPINNSSLHNLNEINISYAYQIVQKQDVFDIAMNDSKSFLEMGRAFQTANFETSKTFFESPEGQNLIHNPNNHFDLLIIEAQFPTYTIFSWKFDIPYIGICSLDCALQYHDTAGNLVHPVSNPDANFRLDNPHKPTFLERLSSFLYVQLYRLVMHLRGYPKERLALQRYFGDDVPHIEDVQNRMSMMFLSTNPVFHYPRALMPNTITIGHGMHVEEPEDLEPEVKEFLDGADQGAVYFSLGSNIKEKHLNATVKAEITKALASLPYRVLWKIDSTFDTLPAHVRTSKWFRSQPAILRHPNLKLFITQGGLQSMQEAIYFGKPMVGIPFFGDQYSNVNRMVLLGYGMKIDKHNVTETSIREAVNEVINNPKFRDSAQKYSEIFKDVDVADVDKAVWWIEYVLRHNGASHFRNRLLEMPFWQRRMLDVYGFLFLVVLLAFKIVSVTVRFVLSTIFRVTKPKNKRD